MSSRSRHNLSSPFFSNQQGVVLVVALVMLLIMTVAGVTTMTGATLQERIAGNQRQQIIARANAERTLRQAEVRLNGFSNGAGFFNNDNQLVQNLSGLNDGLYFTAPISGSGLIQPPAFTRQDSAQWTAANSVAVDDANGNTVGRYIIEYTGFSTFTGEGVGTLGGENNYDNPNQTGLMSADGDGAERKVFRITALGFANDGNVTAIVESRFFERQ